MAICMGLAAGCGPSVESEDLHTDHAGQPVVSSTYVGSQTCATCHASQHAQWSQSHHHLAMAEATPSAVLGDFAGQTLGDTQFRREGAAFLVRAADGTGELADYRVRYAFGVQPLQQYLLELPGGRLQALDKAWDSRPEAHGGQRWVSLQSAEDERLLHWSGPAYNWNHMCADCHSTRVTKGYEGETGAYQTRFAEVSVGCEACHGPASAHVADPVGLRPQALRSAPEQINACAPCHSRRAQLAEGFTPTRNLLDHYLPALLDAGLYHPDGQVLDEVYVYGSFLQSRMHGAGVVCADCHEPHSARLRAEGNALCAQCHNAKGVARFPSLRKADYDSEAHHFHAGSEAASRCVSCHMPESTVMVLVGRRDLSFRIPRPDLSVDLGTPNACNGCHEDRLPQWARDAVARWHGPERPFHFGPLIAAARSGDLRAEGQLAALADDTAQPAIVRATALSLMVSFEQRTTTFALQRGLQDADPLVRIGALRGAARWEPRRRFQIARGLLRDPLLAVRIEAARILAEAYPLLTGSDRERLGEGIDEYARSLRLRADRAEGRSSMATIYLHRGDPAAAERELNAALALNPSWVPALVNLADLYRTTGRDEQGGEPLQRALELAPDSADVLLARGLWLVRRQRANDALGLFARAHQLVPARVHYARIYAIALNSAGDPPAALQVLETALNERPRNEELLRLAFTIARDAGMQQETGDYLRRLELRWSP